MATRKKLLLAVVALVVAAITLTALTAAVLNEDRNIPASGTILTTTSGGDSEGGESSIGLDIYTDAAATTLCSSVEWGTLSPGDVATKTIYLKNSGNSAEVLNMTATQWTPTVAGEVLSLTWNKEGASLNAGAVTAATLVLQVPSNPEGLTSFSLNIVISATAV